MEDLQFIVSRLNDPPFNKNLSLVDFDELQGNDLIKVLADVLSLVDPNVNGEEDIEHCKERILDLLTLLKYPGMHSYNEWIEDFHFSNKDVIYGILNWALSMHSKLIKRSYLAKYLVPIDPPTDYLMQDGTLANICEEYRQAQDEFKDLHKIYEREKSKGKKDSLNDFKKEIDQLDLERQQLEDKIHKIQQSSEVLSSPEFENIFRATKLFRHAQDNEAKLKEKEKDQKNLLADTENRAKALEQQQKKIKKTNPESVAEIMKRLELKLTETKQYVCSQLVLQKSRLLNRIEDFESKSNMNSQKLKELVDEVDHLEGRCIELKVQQQNCIQDESAKENFGLLKKHVKLAVSKLHQTEDEQENRLKLENDLRADISILSKKLKEISDERPSSSEESVSPEEFSTTKNELEINKSKIKSAKIEINRLKIENEALQQTEQNLKEQHHDLEGFLRKQEEITGKADMSPKTTMNELNQIGNLTEDQKYPTLEELLEAIRTTIITLEERKDNLKPKVKILKEVRKKLQITQMSVSEKKVKFDRISLNLSNDRLSLEMECEDLQEECIDEEGSATRLLNLIQIAETELETVRMEEAWEGGLEDRFLPDFQTLQDLYKNKVQQQEQLVKELRAQQRGMEETEGHDLRQRAMFSDLLKLLEMKQKER